MQLYTIGFTKKSAEEFFGDLEKVGVRRVIDVRHNNTNQLAGFAKKEDLAWFLKTISKIDYVHYPILSPSQDLIDAYRKEHLDWHLFRDRFLAELTERHAEAQVDRTLFDDACLLCSEEHAAHCHRTFVAEYLQSKWGDITVTNLGE